MVAYQFPPMGGSGCSVPSNSRNTLTDSDGCLSFTRKTGSMEVTDHSLVNDILLMLR